MTVETFQQPDVRPIGDRKYLLMEDFAIVWRENSARFRIVIPRGFITDLASVPRLLWTLSNFTPDGLIRAAAVIHDWIYAQQGQLIYGQYQVKVGSLWVPCSLPFSRIRADALFKAINTAACMTRKNVIKAWLGVRVGGLLSWWSDDSAKLQAMGMEAA
jgi:hypothetical protein